MSESTFAIGDIHGRSDLLKTLLGGIASLAADESLDYRIVFLGDIIDHGPCSRETVEIVAETLRSIPGSQLILGNHDWFPVRILDELVGDEKDMALEHWLWNLGGDATVQSYDFEPAFFGITDLERHFPKDHLELFRSAAAYVELDQHILVHAGLAPGVRLADQSRRDLMWIREPFLSSRDPFPKTVVHGHTLTKSLSCEVAPHRVGIDTGAVESNRLSAALIQTGKPMRFMATSPRHTGRVELVEPVYLEAAALA